MQKLIARGYRVLHMDVPQDPEVLMGVCPSKKAIVINDLAKEDAKVILYLTQEDVYGADVTSKHRRITK